ncbi:Valine--tRNA ligase [Planctomycetes bacterium Pan216]|uniref:Valine--tRNA ligase n=1 Tax=Kolteria novifilia TaxID=2527975 RepID=A0A518B4N0_9BACT|nr:Valine--tRNA ligase [Planctomycetes bacterium Pan216]
MTPLTQNDPKAIQDRWTKLWDEGKHFQSAPDPSKKPYTIVIPPPNVTGALHLGHALNGTLQDVMIRFKRMQGFEALWIPGADHAGIATQAVVEKRLFEQEKLTRHDIGREELVRRIWAWKDEHEDRIMRQLKAMGVSCDWSRWSFTLDETRARAVRVTFFNMFRDQLIYRGKRLVNWDVQLHTAVADDEVYHDEVKGHLWHINYPVEGSDRLLEVATTRPETMLGDTAVAVHPKDERYLDLIGMNVVLPLVGRKIPIIADGQLVNPEFGTGVVKVTPAHDPNDYACGLRNKLEMINILEPDGRINENGGKFQGLKREQARKSVVEALEAEGLVVKVEDHVHQVGHSDRSKTAVEPYLSDQWFIQMDELAEKAMAAVREQRVKIHPPRYADTYLSWLSEKRDWCISRQLWWGHQIPIWYAPNCSEVDLEKAFAGRDDVVWQEDKENDRWLLCSLEDLAENAVPGTTLQRDPDVLDTWFSSALWPHSTMGWPDHTPDLEYYYPTSLLSTAREIITLWVARMVIMSDYNMGTIPFSDVYIHPVIQDGNGMPMKKSLGNGVDPFDIIEKYGADAMRYTLVSMATETQDVRLPVKKEKVDGGRQINTSEKFEIGRNFGTKIFNAAKFSILNLEGFIAGPVDEDELMIEDRWILDRLSRTTRSVTEALDGYRFNDVGRTLYDFVWSEFCDWYIEIVKPRFRDEKSKVTAQRVLAAVLDAIVRLLHPVMPFVSEEIWQALGEVAPSRGVPTPSTANAVVTTAPWPKPLPSWENDTIAAQMSLLQDVIRCVRNIRGEFTVDPKSSVDVVVDGDAESSAFLLTNQETIKLLAKVGNFSSESNASRPAMAAAHVLPTCKVYVPLADHIDLDAELGKQEKKKTDLEKRLKGVDAKLSNEGFVSRAPAEVVDQQRRLRDDLVRQVEAVTAIINELNA